MQWHAYAKHWLTLLLFTLFTQLTQVDFFSQCKADARTANRCSRCRFAEEVRTTICQCRVPNFSLNGASGFGNRRTILGNFLIASRNGVAWEATTFDNLRQQADTAEPLRSLRFFTTRMREAEIRGIPCFSTAFASVILDCTH
ncbi:hypothetical protein BaRGS_00008950 [Batillaria attramentaria]|uniref:Uncharacterized protein n=1 Tax=Batillaria attramentaria TaxID=370345 RepID=A0ABD0LK02_9CAEN